MFAFVVTADAVGAAGNTSRGAVVGDVWTTASPGCKAPVPLAAGTDGALELAERLDATTAKASAQNTAARPSAMVCSRVGNLLASSTPEWKASTVAAAPMREASLDRSDA